MDEARLREAALQLVDRVPYLTIADQVRGGRPVETAAVAEILSPILRALLAEVVEECAVRLTDWADTLDGSRGGYWHGRESGFRDAAAVIRERFSWLRERRS